VVLTNPQKNQNARLFHGFGKITPTAFIILTLLDC